MDSFHFAQAALLNHIVNVDASITVLLFYVISGFGATRATRVIPKKSYPENIDKTKEKQWLSPFRGNVCYTEKSYPENIDKTKEKQ